ncbi:hypothetical protein T492DRAFT_1146254 [Pavlovales sp. CCMP2436]|nr:hypothetical protein T492DRAFT_1146254 [Pavlovales sp. CCMP2436]
MPDSCTSKKDSSKRPGSTGVSPQGSAPQQYPPLPPGYERRDSRHLEDVAAAESSSSGFTGSDGGFAAGSVAAPLACKEACVLKSPTRPARFDPLFSALPPPPPPPPAVPPRAFVAEAVAAAAARPRGGRPPTMPPIPGRATPDGVLLPAYNDHRRRSSDDGQGEGEGACVPGALGPVAKTLAGCGGSCPWLLGLGGSCASLSGLGGAPGSGWGSCVNLAGCGGSCLWLSRCGSGSNASLSTSDVAEHSAKESSERVQQQEQRGPSPLELPGDAPRVTHQRTHSSDSSGSAKSDKSGNSLRTICEHPTPTSTPPHSAPGLRPGTHPAWPSHGAAHALPALPPALRSVRDGEGSGSTRPSRAVRFEGASGAPGEDALAHARAEPRAALAATAGGNCSERVVGGGELSLSGFSLPSHAERLRARRKGSFVPMGGSGNRLVEEGSTLTHTHGGGGYGGGGCGSGGYVSGGYGGGGGGLAQSGGGRTRTPQRLRESSVAEPFPPSVLVAGALGFTAADAMAALASAARVLLLSPRLHKGAKRLLALSVQAATRLLEEGTCASARTQRRAAQTAKTKATARAAAATVAREAEEASAWLVALALLALVEWSSLALCAARARALLAGALLRPWRSAWRAPPAAAPVQAMEALDAVGGGLIPGAGDWRRIAAAAASAHPGYTVGTLGHALGGGLREHGAPAAAGGGGHGGHMGWYGGHRGYGGGAAHPLDEFALLAVLFCALLAKPRRQRAAAAAITAAGDGGDCGAWPLMSLSGADARGAGRRLRAGARAPLAHALPAAVCWALGAVAVGACACAPRTQHLTLVALAGTLSLLLFARPHGASRAEPARARGRISWPAAARPDRTPTHRRMHSAPTRTV